VRRRGAHVDALPSSSRAAAVRPERDVRREADQAQEVDLVLLREASLDLDPECPILAAGLVEEARTLLPAELERTAQDLSLGPGSPRIRSDDRLPTPA